MMLTQQKEEAQITGKTEIKEFDIGDPTIIIDFLSKNIYSNPIKICTQEYITNARDAHIEVGKKDVPILVKLPNRFDPTFKIRDFGPGITPQRMKDVFIRYGVSTKRKDNGQSGGWGLGCKSAWSYTDTFEIRTISNVDGNLTLINYAAIKEKGMPPRLVEFGEPIIINVDDPSIPDEDKTTGTTISFNVKTDDFDKFKQQLIEITQFWDVRPIISGCNPIPEYRTVKWAYEGKNWKIGFEKGYYSTSFVCIDGIPYPLDRSTLQELSAALEVNELLNNQFVLFFNVGELSVSLNRENLHYDEQTISNIVNRLVEIKKWLKDNVESQIQNAKTFWEANCLYSKLTDVFHGNKFVGKVLWNGVHVTGSNLPIVNGYCRRYSFFDGTGAIVNSKMTSKRYYDIQVRENSLLVLCDEDKISSGKVLTILNANPSHYIYVIKPDNLSEWQKKINLDLYEPIKMSTVVKTKLPKCISANTIKRPKGPKHTIKSVEVLTSDVDNSVYEDVNYETGGGLYIISHRNTYTGTFWQQKHDMRSFLNYFASDKKVYIISSRYQEKIFKNPNFTMFSDFVKTVYKKEIKKIDLKQYKIYSESSSYTFSSNFYSTFADVVEKYSDKLDQNTDFFKWYNESKDINKKLKNIDEETKFMIHLNKLIEGDNIVVNDSDLHIKKLHDKCNHIKIKLDNWIKYPAYIHFDTPNDKKVFDFMIIDLINKLS